MNKEINLRLNEINYILTSACDKQKKINYLLIDAVSNSVEACFFLDFLSANFFNCSSPA